MINNWLFALRKSNKDEDNKRFGQDANWDFPLWNSIRSIYLNIFL